MPSLDNTADEKPAIDPILLKVLDAVPFRLSIDDGIEAVRQRLRDLPRQPVHPELRVVDLAIDGPAGPIGTRIYWPPTCPDQAEAPVVLYFHGGGFVMGDLDTHDGTFGLLDQPGGGVGSVVGDVADPLRRVLVSDGNIGHPGLRTLSQQRVQMGAASGQPDYLETVRIVGDDLKRLGADRAGTAQHHHPQPAVSAPVGRVGHLIIVRHHLVVTAPPDHDASTGSHTSPWNAIVLMPALDAKMPCVRTTIRIDDELYREVKAKAARSGRTVAAVLEDAVRRGLNPPKPQAAGRYRVQPSGKGGLRPGVDLSSNAALAEAMNDGVSVDAVR